MHELSIPMRWSDLDLLGHVNNVNFVAYAEQAHLALPAELRQDERPLTGIDVEFHQPLLLSRTPVVVWSDREGDALVHRIGKQGAAFDAGDAYATVRLGQGYSLIPPVPVDGTDFTLAVRPSDRGADGSVTPTRFFEICQEARILSFGEIMPGSVPGRYVVARVDVSLAAPVTADVESLTARTALTRVGRSSFATTTWFDDGHHGSARAVLVGFDLDTQRSRPFDDEERAALEAALVRPETDGR